MNPFSFGIFITLDHNLHRITRHVICQAIHLRDISHLSKSKDKRGWVYLFIIGTEGGRGLALQGNTNKSKVIHIPKDGKLLKIQPPM